MKYKKFMAVLAVATAVLFVVACVSMARLSYWKYQYELAKARNGETVTVKVEPNDGFLTYYGYCEANIGPHDFVKIVCELNGLADNYVLQPGDVIIIPLGRIN